MAGKRMLNWDAIEAGTETRDGTLIVRRIGDRVPGVALCLSGGGFRAMLFHVGAVWRLVELGVMPQLKLVSAVSGGSIIAGMLATHWKTLREKDFANYADVIVPRCLEIVNHTVDVRAVLFGLQPNRTPAQGVAELYSRRRWRAPGGGREALFNEDGEPLLLGDLDDCANIEFEFNATLLNNGRRWRASTRAIGSSGFGNLGAGETLVAVASRMLRGVRKRLAATGALFTLRDGELLTDASQITLAEAIACSGAFPPVLSPFLIQPSPPAPGQPPGPTAVITDGGVFDNLGIQPAMLYETILVSDGGGVFDRAGFIGFTVARVFGIPFQLKRVFDAIDARSREQIRQWLFDRYALELDPEVPQSVRQRYGRRIAYWLLDHELPPFDAVRPVEIARRQLAADAPPALVVDKEVGRALARVGTRLGKISAALAHQLVNLGYARADWYVRAMCPELVRNAPPPRYPFADVNLAAPLVPAPVQLPVIKVRWPYLALAIALLNLLYNVVVPLTGIIALAVGGAAITALVIGLVLLRPARPVGVKGVHHAA